MVTGGIVGSMAGCTEGSENSTPTSTAAPESPGQESDIAVSPEESAKLSAPDGAEWDRFGNAVALDGDTAIVGSFRDKNSNGEYAGAVYVFELQNGAWEMTTKLTAQDRKKNASFGERVALSGDRAIVSAPTEPHSDTQARGAAYIYHRSGGEWQLEADLRPVARVEDNHFGSAVAIDDDLALVGDKGGPTDAGEQTGVMYAFSRSSGDWQREDVFWPDNDSVDQQFGSAISLDGDNALIGAHETEVAGQNRAGVAYVFSRTDDGWQQESTLVADDVNRVDQFGSALSLAGETAVISSPTDEDPYADDLPVGSAYVFSRTGDGWQQQTKLMGDEGQTHVFGSAVRLRENITFIGAAGDEANGENAGAVFVFTKSSDGWQRETKVLPEDGDSEDLFGNAIDVAERTLLVGATKDEQPNGKLSGSAYVYEF